jgi:hypothetical protein
MAASAVYLEKLKDPRWQKKRLEILERDAWTCQVCQNTENTLHVHHCWYENDIEPWDYPGECFVTLCEPCHEAEPKGVSLTWIQRKLGGCGKVAIDTEILIQLFDIINLATTKDTTIISREDYETLRAKITENLRSFYASEIS